MTIKISAVTNDRDHQKLEAHERSRQLAAKGSRTIAHIKKPLAEELLFGKLTKGGIVKVGVKDGELELHIEEPQKARITNKVTKPPLLTAE